MNVLPTEHRKEAIKFVYENLFLFTITAGILLGIVGIVTALIRMVLLFIALVFTNNYTREILVFGTVILFMKIVKPYYFFSSFCDFREAKERFWNEEGKKELLDFAKKNKKEALLIVLATIGMAIISLLALALVFKIFMWNAVEVFTK